MDQIVPGSRPQLGSTAVSHNQGLAGFVDIHTHLLPGIDDGPPDEGGSVAMAAAAAEAGTDVLAATPHLRDDFPAVRIEELAERCARVQAAVHAAGIQLRIIPGAEVSLGWALEASDEQLRLASYDQRGTDLLVEPPPGPVVGLGTLLSELGTRGLRITLAHPERSAHFQRDPAALAGLVREGVLVQINAASLLDRGRRSPAGRLARRLCRDGLAHALASDGHRAKDWRPVTTQALGVRAAAELIGRERAAWMAVDAPAAIMAGDDFPGPPEVDRQRRLKRSLRSFRR